MSVITKGRIFANGEQLTAEKLNVLVDDASFNSSTAVDNSTTRVNASGAITVKPQGITSTELASGAVESSNLATSVLNAIYPVGSVYINATNATNPGTLLGFGTWNAFGAGRVPVGIDSSDADFDAVGIGQNTNETTGAKTHTLTIDEMPSHDHVPNRNTYGTHNLLLRRKSNGAGSTNGADYTVGEPDISSYGCGLPEVEGNGDAHNNLQPYIVVYMWKRTA